MPLEVLPNKFNMVGDDAVMVMGNGLFRQAVFVTKDAMHCARSSSRKSISRFTQSLAVFAAIASEKFDEGMIAFDGRVWVTAADIRDWQESSTH